MADYYPLISRAVSGLSQNTATHRRALYQRIRDAFETKISEQNPTLDDARVANERRSLEEAIRKVENEFGARSTGGDRANADRQNTIKSVIETSVTLPEAREQESGATVPAARGSLMNRIFRCLIGIGLLFSSFVICMAVFFWSLHGAAAPNASPIVIGLLMAPILIGEPISKSYKSPPVIFLILSGVIPGLLAFYGWRFIHGAFPPRSKAADVAPVPGTAHFDLSAEAQAAIEFAKVYGCNVRWTADGALEFARGANKSLCWSDSDVRRFGASLTKEVDQSHML